MFRKLAVVLVISVLVAATGFISGINLVSPWDADVQAVFNPFSLLGSYEKERTDGGYFVLADEQGNVLDETSMQVYKGDEFIDADNHRYQVVRVEGDVAHCKFIGIETLAWDDTELLSSEEAVPAATTKPLVGIYHSHGDESYVPSQKTSSVPKGEKGGVAAVAATLRGKLESLGISAVYDDTTHAPHDSGAYHRSRRTVAKLLKEGAQILIDIHRDAAPVKNYRVKIKGDEVARIKMVVGRRNPNYKANLGYAKKIKASLDKMYPGLMKGIFIGRGSYNQDLSPTCLLVEAGSHRNSLDAAKAGIGLFANALPKITGVNPQTGAKQVSSEADDRGNFKSLGGILAVLVLGGLGFLIISTGSIGGAINKLKHFGGSEWTNFFGRRRTREIIEEEVSQNEEKNQYSPKRESGDKQERE